MAYQLDYQMTKPKDTRLDTLWSYPDIHVVSFGGLGFNMHPTHITFERAGETVRHLSLITEDCVWLIVRTRSQILSSLLKAQLNITEAHTSVFKIVQDAGEIKEMDRRNCARRLKKRKQIQKFFTKQRKEEAALQKPNTRALKQIPPNLPRNLQYNLFFLISALLRHFNSPVNSFRRQLICSSWRWNRGSSNCCFDANYLITDRAHRPKSLWWLKTSLQSFHLAAKKFSLFAVLGFEPGTSGSQLLLSESLEPELLYL